jgi:hypothetical protein
VFISRRLIMETVIERSNVVLTESPAASGISAVSWAAVFAGAVAAAAMSLILFILGIGLGLGAMSPWSASEGSGEGVDGGALGVSTILWITLTSLVASGVGGYLTGRLRTRWLAVHTDEVFFRDTAHGFLAWSLATLLTAVIFTTATAGVVSMGVKAGAAVAGGIAESSAAAAGAVAAGDASSAGNAGTRAVSYHLDSLFRTSVLTRVPVNQIAVQPATTGVTQQQQEAAADAASTEEGAAALNPAQQAALSAGGASSETMVPTQQRARGRNMDAPQDVVTLPEVARIFTRALGNDTLPPEDLTYVGRLVAQHTGLSEMEAEARVSDIFARTQAELNQMETTARAAADEARATSMKVALWFFVALLIGAFVGSYSATLGGRQRDF